jgi:glycosyltransferase involved in cell wall biosynthesis
MTPSGAWPGLVSVVAPVYNEEDTVAELVDRICLACRAANSPFEVVIVDDGSRDDTLRRLIELSSVTPELYVVGLSRNFGYTPAQSAGLRAARGEAVVIMDGDLQDPPEVIPELVREWMTGRDVVFAKRRTRRDGVAMRVAARIYYWLLARIADAPIPEQSGTFSLLDRRVVDALNSFPERTRYFVGLRAWVGGSQGEVTYDRQPRRSGRSRLALRGRFRLAEAAYLAFSKTPLRVASLLSLVTALALFSVGVFAIVVRLFFARAAVPGWAATTVLIGTMGFMQSLILAAIAEYVGVVFDEVKGRPLYLVRGEYHRGQLRLGPEHRLAKDQ